MKKLILLSLALIALLSGFDSTLFAAGPRGRRSARSNPSTGPSHREYNPHNDRRQEGPCTLKINGAHAARIIVGQTAQFEVESGGRRLNVYWVGDMDGQMDAGGVSYGGVTPHSFFYTYSPNDLHGASVRRFTRYAVLKDDAGHIQCTTNNIFIQLLEDEQADAYDPPAAPCALRVSGFSFNVRERATFAIDSAAGLYIYWVGDRDGQADTQAKHFGELTPYQQSYQFSAADAGSSGRSRYTRYAILKDAQERIHCTTNNIVALVHYSSLNNNTVFPSSRLLLNAHFASERFNPPPDLMYGDITPTTWARDGELYTAISDGGVGSMGGQHLMARVTGEPPDLHFTLIGPPDPLTTFGRRKRYSLGLTSVNGILYATRTKDWEDALLLPFEGLEGIWWSDDLGQTWHGPPADWPFGRRAGNLNWVMEGQDATNPDGYMYAICSEREFNASNIFLGRVRPGDSGRATVANPAHWQWYAGTVNGTPQWVARLEDAQSLSGLDPQYPGEFWHHKVSYPQMTYNAGLGRYLLVFSYSYVDDQTSESCPPEAPYCEVWRGGAELVVLEAEHPWGPFSFVYREPNWGPSNGYAGAFLIKWQSRDGLDLWMKWAANWFGCSEGLDCSGVYGYNLRKMRLDTLTSLRDGNRRSQ